MVLWLVENLVKQATVDFQGFVSRAAMLGKAVSYKKRCFNFLYLS
jgi:hypothetical protein